MFVSGTKRAEVGQFNKLKVQENIHIHEQSATPKIIILVGIAMLLLPHSLAEDVCGCLTGFFQDGSPPCICAKGFFGRLCEKKMEEHKMVSLISWIVDFLYENIKAVAINIVLAVLAYFGKAKDMAIFNKRFLFR